MATGMAIMGFGGGAMIGSPLATLLINGFAVRLPSTIDIMGFAVSLPFAVDFTFAGFRTANSVGVWETFLALGAIYFVFMLIGAFGYRVPPAGWRPEGWTPSANGKSMITARNVHLHDAHKTAAFWLIWLVLLLNVSAGIGVIGIASPMLQEIFGGSLISRPELTYAQVQADPALKAAAAIVAAGGFVGLLSLFNIGGRFFWASLSDVIGRKTTYAVFFLLGIALYAAAPTSAHLGSMALFVASFCIILSMYGGGFSTVPAYLADIFGTQYVGAIHGRLLTAWSVAGIVGPVVVNYIREAQIKAGVPRDQLYDFTMYILAGMLVLGFICNLLVRHVAEKRYMSEADVAAAQGKAAAAAIAPSGSFGIGRGAIYWPGSLVFWTFVGIPLAWGVWTTVQQANHLFE
jgi:MFS family permease